MTLINRAKILTHGLLLLIVALACLPTWAQMTSEGVDCSQIDVLGIDKQDLANQSLYHVFENVYRRKLQRAEEDIGAVSAAAEVAEILQTSVGSPLLSIRETTYDSQNIAIEYSISLLRADRYTASVISVRRA